MKKILLTATAILSMIAFTACCGENYVKEMTKISNSISQQLVEFYQKNKRFPTIKERNRIFETVGCTFKQENICTYRGRNITIESKIHLNEYNIRLYLGKNFCSFWISSDGRADSISCRKEDCISLKQ